MKLTSTVAAGFAIMVAAGSLGAHWRPPRADTGIYEWPPQAAAHRPVRSAKVTRLNDTGEQIAAPARRTSGLLTRAPGARVTPGVT